MLHQLGAGATAAVWLARERPLDRLVALKFIAQTGDSRLAQRLIREGKAGARLRHPNIVAVHAMNVTNSSAFLAMDFLEGGDLRERLRRGLFSPREAAELARKLAGALAHAHANGVLHRDIKPSNVLLNVAGEPHLADFGLAAPLHGGGDITLPGQVAGTAAYLAPELLAGAEQASPLSDLYGLGALLYESLTGRAPFVGDSSASIFAQLAQADPPPPRLLRPDLPRELETICLKCLEKSPSRRYGSAQALQDDLDRFLRGEPISARPLGPIGRANRWARKNRTIAAATGTFLVVALIGLVAVLSQWQRAQRANATIALNLYAADLRVASDALLVGDLGTARHTLESCPLPLRDAAWGLLWPFTHGDIENEFLGAHGTITAIAVSPDRRFLATTAQADTAKLWDLSSGSLVGEFPGTRFSWAAQFSIDGRRLFTADTKVKVWGVTERRILQEFPGRSCTLSPDGEILYTCAGHRFLYEGSPGSVTAWRLRDGQKLFEINDPTRVIAVSPNGVILATADAQNTIALHDAHDGRLLSDPWSGGPVWQLAFSPDSRLLVASGWTADVRIWDLSNSSRSPRVLKHPRITWGVSFTPNGNILAVASSDRLLHRWDVSSWQEKDSFRGQFDEMWSVASDGNESWFSGGRDARLLHLKQRPMLDTVRHDPYSTNVVWVPDGRLATVRGSAKTHETEIVSVHGNSEAARFSDEIPLVFDARTQQLWLWADQGELRARAAPHWQLVASQTLTLRSGEKLVGTPEVVPAAHAVWFALEDGSLVVQPLESNRRLARVEHVFERPTEAAALSPDGQHFVWGGVSTQLFLLDLADGTRRSLSGHRYEVASVIFAPDGKTFVSGGTDGWLLQWDAVTGTRIRKLGEHPTSVGHLAFSTDGRVLFTEEATAGIHAWHMASGREVGYIRTTGADTTEWLGVSLEDGWLGRRRADGSIQVFPLADARGESR